MQTGVRNGCKIAKRGTLNTKYAKLSDGGALIFRLFFIFYFWKGLAISRFRASLGSNMQNISGAWLVRPSPDWPAS